MSYLDERKRVEAENEERERRKIEDELELNNEEALKISDLHVDYKQYVECSEDPDRKISYSGVSIQYEQNRKVNYLNFFLFFI